MILRVQYNINAHNTLMFVLLDSALCLNKPYKKSNQNQLNAFQLEKRNNFEIEKR